MAEIVIPPDQWRHAEKMRVGDHLYLAMSDLTPWWEHFWYWIRPMFELYGLPRRPGGVAMVTEIDLVRHTITIGRIQ